MTPVTQAEINKAAWGAYDTFRGVVDPSVYKDYVLSHVVSFNDASLERIDKAFRAAAVWAGLHEVTLYTLKHTAVTWAFKRGMTLEDATAYFATSRETLENVYRAYSPDALRSAAGIMNVKL